MLQWLHSRENMQNPYRYSLSDSLHVKKLTDWANDRGIKHKTSLLSPILLLIMGGGGILAAPSTLTLTSTAVA